MRKKYILIDLFFTFFRLGLFTFGGGYVMIPFIEKEMVDKKKWIDHEEIVDIIAITQSIPGALSINMSALVGYKIAKVKGTITSVLAVSLPSFIIIVLIAVFFKQFQDVKAVQNALLGIRSCVVALIAYSAVKITKSAAIDIGTALITFITVLLLLFSNLHPILIILGGAIFGLTTYFISPKTTKKIIERNNNDTN